MSNIGGVRYFLCHWIVRFLLGSFTQGLSPKSELHHMLLILKRPVVSALFRHVNQDNDSHA